MNLFPKITIVTPSYNQGRFLEATILSVLNQDYPNLEYIVMDGGSTDESLEIIKRHADKLAYWESGKDCGQADAIFRGFERASGDILGWINSDDLLLPGSLEKVARHFAAHPEEDWVTGGSIIIDDAGKCLLNRIGWPRCNLGDRVTFHRLLYSGCSFNQPASFWRRESFLATGGFDRALRFCFDYDMYLLLAQKSPSGNIKSFIACFRVHPDSKSSTIHDICIVENELLWEKYGRLEKPKWCCSFMAQYYTIRRLVRLCVLQARLKVGSLEWPQTSS